MLIRKTLTLVRWQGRNAILQLESGKELEFSKEDIPAETAVGAQFSLTLQPLHEATLNQEELARTLLNQIIAQDNDSIAGK